MITKSLNEIVPPSTTPYKVKVKAEGDNELYRDSEWSNEVEVTISQYAKVVDVVPVSSDQPQNLKWKEVPGAEGYVVEYYNTTSHTWVELTHTDTADCNFSNGFIEHQEIDDTYTTLQVRISADGDFTKNYSDTVNINRDWTVGTCSFNTSSGDFTFSVPVEYTYMRVQFTSLASGSSTPVSATAQLDWREFEVNWKDAYRNTSVEYMIHSQITSVAVRLIPYGYGWVVGKTVYTNNNVSRPYACCTSYSWDTTLTTINVYFDGIIEKEVQLKSSIMVFNASANATYDQERQKYVAHFNIANIRSTVEDCDATSAIMSFSVQSTLRQTWALGAWQSATGRIKPLIQQYVFKRLTKA